MIKLFTILLFTFFSLQLFGQAGSIRGQVIGEGESEGLPGATIRITGTSQGVVTDINGNFILTNVPVGEMEIEVSYVGYELKKQTIDVRPGDNNLESLVMTQGITLGEVMVSAQVHGQQTAIQEQRASDAIVNIVSADKIQELPDVNAAEAIARLPGVAINRSGGEGQKVVIRGMAPKFAAITLNGVRMPSNDPSDRSSDLSIISPELLSGIEVFKSPLPDMDAESTAGTVNLRLRQAPKGFRLLAKGLGGYNQLNSDYGDYKGLLQVSNRAFKNKLGFVAQSSVERFNRSGSLIDYDWTYPGQSDDGIPDTIIGTRFTLRQQQEIRRRFNSSLSLDYKLKEGHKLAFYGLFTRTTRDRTLSNVELDYSGNEINYTSNDIENGLDLFSGSLSGEHPVGKGLIDWSIGRSTTIGETPYSLFSEFSQEPGATSNFPPGLGHPRIYLDSVRLSDVERLYVNDFSESQTRENSSTYLINVQRPIKISSSLRLNLKIGAKYYGIERSRSQNVIGERLYGIGSGVQPSVDAYQERYGEDLILSSDGQRIRLENFIQDEFRPQVILENGDKYTIARTPDPDLMRKWYRAVNHLWKPNGVGFPDDNYDLRENIYAVYAMVKVNIGDDLLIIPGVRYENSDNQYNGVVSPQADETRDGSEQAFAAIRDTTANVNYQNFFPHLHFKYTPLDWLEVRASYASTIARPDFTRLIPRLEIRQNNATISAGNSGLKPMITNNYDVSVGFFKQGIGYLTVGAFYKDIDNFFTSQTFPITSAGEGEPFGIDGRSGFKLSTHVNLKESKVYGLEFDVQSNLAALPAPWNGVVVNLNFAKLYSETTIFFLETISRFQPGSTIPVVESFLRERRVGLISQAPGIMRASLGYDYKGFSFRVSTAYQATKVRQYSLGVQQYDRYDLAFWRVDAVVKQKIGERWSAFLNLNNLSNQQDIITRSKSDKTYIDEIETFGPTYQLGIQFSMR